MSKSTTTKATTKAAAVDTAPIAAAIDTADKALLTTPKGGEVKSAAPKVSTAKAAKNEQAVELESKRKAENATAEEIGSAAIPAAKLEVLRKAKAKANGIFALVIEQAMRAHKSHVTPAAMSDAKIPADVAAEYSFKVSTLRTAVLRYAEALHGGADEAITATKSAVFIEWKAYLAMLNGGKVNATAEDAAHLYHAAIYTAKTAATHEVYTRNDGTLGARLATGTAADTPKSPNAFAKELERLAVDRLCGLDGILSIKAAKAAKKAAAAKREQALELATAEMTVETPAAS